MEFINLRDEHDLGLLTRVYQELYLPNFRIPRERESVEHYRSMLFEKRPPPPQPMLNVVVAGDHLRDAERSSLHGFVIFETYLLSGCGLMSFLAVDPGRRGRGIARSLVLEGRTILMDQASKHGAGGRLRAIFAEAHDPGRVDPADEPVNPIARLGALARLGARCVPIVYVQPELRPGAGRSYDLFLLALPVDEAEPLAEMPAAIVSGFMHEFYQAQGVELPEQDPDFRIIVDSIEHAVQVGPTAEIPPAGLPIVGLVG